MAAAGGRAIEGLYTFPLSVKREHYWLHLKGEARAAVQLEKG